LEARIDLLEWDTHHFGFKIARLTEPRDADQIREGIAAAEQAGVRCLVTLIGLDQTAVIVAAEDAGFRSYDVRLEFDRAPRDSGAAAEPIAATNADLPRFETIARASFSDSRFYADPNFADESAAEMYALWVRRGMNDPERLLLTTKELGGFIVCHCNAVTGIGTVELIAVDDRVRGNGVGSQLLKSAEAAFSDAGMARARVVTQAGNVAAQRFYQRWGYRTASASLWLHRWTDDR
jgi:ribosomal protein S18 acetylase RimI-like enzyme